MERLHYNAVLTCTCTLRQTTTVFFKRGMKEVHWYLHKLRNKEMGRDDSVHEVVASHKITATGFLDPVHRLMLYKSGQKTTFREMNLLPSSGNKVPTLLGPLELVSIIVTRLRAGRPGFHSREGLELSSSPPLWGPPSLLSNGYRGVSPRG
jgi:hypothetical protein